MASGLKVAFVGAGYMAEEHMRAFASLPDVIIAGVYSRTRERAEKLAAVHGTQVYDSVSDLYSKTKADLVVVTVILGLSNASWLLIVALAVAAPGLVLIIEARAQRR